MKIEVEEKIEETSFDETNRVRKKDGKREREKEKNRMKNENKVEENREEKKNEKEDPYKHLRVGFKRKFEVKEDEMGGEGYKRREMEEDIFLQMIFEEIQKINVYNQVNCHILD